MEAIINFLLQYWLLSALVVSGWAFFRFVTYNRKNVANVKGNGNVINQSHTIAERERRKEIDKLLETLANQNKIRTLNGRDK